jgi:hypothetical protein
MQYVYKKIKTNNQSTTKFQEKLRSLGEKEKSIRTKREVVAEDANKYNKH